MTLSPEDQERVIQRAAEILADRYEDHLRAITVLTVQQAAQRLGVSGGTIRKMFRLVSLGERKRGVRLTDIVDYIDGQAQQATI